MRRFLVSLIVFTIASPLLADIADDAWEAYRLLTIDGWIAIVFTLAVGGMQPDEWMEVTAVRAIHTMLDLDLAGALDKALR